VVWCLPVQASNHFAWTSRCFMWIRQSLAHNLRCASKDSKHHDVAVFGSFNYWLRKARIYRSCLTRYRACGQSSPRRTPPRSSTRRCQLALAWMVLPFCFRNPRWKAKLYDFSDRQRAMCRCAIAVNRNIARAHYIQSPMTREGFPVLHHQSIWFSRRRS